MCDINPDKLEVEELMIRKENKLYKSTCMKCKDEKAVVVIRIHDPLCRSCFLTYVTHKFRSTLGKSKLIQANDNVLLALSGGHSSTALLHLVRDALSVGAHKRLRFFPAVICIDESETLPPAEGQDYSHIKELAEQFGYTFYQFPIYKDFANLDDEMTNGILSTENDRQKFKECFDSMSSLTAKQDFLVTRRAWLIVSIARKYSFKKIMFGDTATSLCMKLICNISLGRGGTIPLDMGISDNRFPEITIIRPMRELSSKEVAIFNRLSEISVHLPYNIITMKNNCSSLQQKTEEFINGLQTDFPHTVNTVFRTGDKVCTKERFATDCAICPMCQSPVLDSNPIVTKENCSNKDGCCGSSDECSSNNSFKLTGEDMRSQLCYACNLTFKDMGYNVDCLPKQILDQTCKQINRGKMKDSIREFLLE